MIIAVDFDGTLQVNGKPNEALFMFLISCQQAGNVVILNTCRNGKRLEEAVVFCAKQGLRFQAVNQNLPHVIRQLGYDPRKIYADLYIDDKAKTP